MPVSLIRRLDTMLVSNDCYHNDDLSVASSCSFEVDNLRPNKVQKVQQKSRRVIFDEQANVHHSCTHFKEDTANRWYASNDYKRFKADNSECAKSIIREEIVNKNDFESYLSVMERLYSSCCVTTCEWSHVDAQRLQQLLSNADDKCGLEKITTRCIRLDKKARRAELVESVLELQEEYGVSDRQKADMIAQTAQQISEPSKCMAARIAQAAQA